MAKPRVRSNRTVTFRLDDAKLQQIIKASEGRAKTYYIADGVEYGVFIELGTSRTAARPCLVPAFNKVQFGIPPAIGRAIEAGVNIFDILQKAAFDIQRLYQESVPVATGALKNSIHVEEE